MSAATKKQQTGREGFDVIAVIHVPYILTRLECARIFGKSPSWFDAFLGKDGAPLLKAARFINGRRVFKTEDILSFIEQQTT